MNLSPRQRQVLNLMVEGKSTKEISRILSISADTVRVHKRFIYVKLGDGSASRLRAAQTMQNPIRLDVLALRRQGKTYGEIAKQLNTTVGVVAGHLARIRERDLLGRKP